MVAAQNFGERLFKVRGGKHCARTKHADDVYVSWLEC